MSYQDAIAGFAQLHRAFRDNADRKKDLITQQIDINAKERAADKQREFLSGESVLDRVARQKGIETQVAPAHRQVSLAKEKFEKFGEARLEGLEAGTRNLNQEFGIKATDHIMDKKWAAEAERSAIEAGLDPDDDIDRSVIIAMRAAGYEKGAQILKKAVAETDRDSRMKAALEGISNTPWLEKIVRGDGVLDATKTSLLKSMFGDTEMKSLNELVRLGAISPQAITNQSSVQKVNENRYNFLSRLQAGY